MSCGAVIPLLSALWISGFYLSWMSGSLSTPSLVCARARCASVTVSPICSSPTHPVKHHQTIVFLNGAVGLSTILRWTGGVSVYVYTILAPLGGCETVPFCCDHLRTPTKGFCLSLTCLRVGSGISRHT
ncbi:hypothetical protein BC832DRAFT_84446 [Gaertneriomyces semiglobifer]|nr:hypothetical protein BC832DRAFT_84446 [Gaertneriomyces semiglobifer]